MSIGVLVYMHGWFDTSQFISWCSHGNCEMLGYSCCGHWRDGGHESCCDWLAGWSQKMYWLVVDLPLYMEIYGSVYSQYIENKIYVLQWIGFVGKIYWFKPIFHGKIYGFRFRFSQLNQSKKMYCSILTGGMIWKRIHLNIHINFRRLLPVPDLYIYISY